LLPKKFLCSLTKNTELFNFTLYNGWLGVGSKRGVFWPSGHGFAVFWNFAKSEAKTASEVLPRWGKTSVPA
ncbi:MAG: hypothetical protein KKA80_04110, partial [Candidatus Omnitrophica bacterium]|nr:hypothetical protein [Candidatus Omnitrophota bacterium]